MLLRHYVELPYPLATVADALLKDPSSWIPGLAREALGREEGLMAEVGFSGPCGGIRKKSR